MLGDIKSNVSMKTRDQILKEIGFDMPKFNTNDFMETVSTFFREQKDPSSTILLVPKRFVDMEHPPAGSFIDYLDVSIWERKVDDLDDPFDFIDYSLMVRRGLIRPIIFIDEPFVKNAVQLLKMYGFVSKSRQRNKQREYIISLI